MFRRCDLHCWTEPPRKRIARPGARATLAAKYQHRGGGIEGYPERPLQRRQGRSALELFAVSSCRHFDFAISCASCAAFYWSRIQQCSKRAPGPCHISERMAIERMVIERGKERLLCSGQRIAQPARGQYEAGLIGAKTLDHRIAALYRTHNCAH
jgi:hypothetical protein